ncbi:oligosaccharide flippase family protein [Sporolituus thermophilus]|uniref:Na+-driven multidrug efflux pump n=1 Tax=Sporolituus thermophilus DSM 23256 TaxID=1123285 RepID=A0A1G7NCL8_9FIRM|nr:oligosaccharide flippase family protein [Sporolituus thermophilus]SDF71712.1 Na+-driven multidrug efflux pump [Sporolituus thermophilus DSM 23256]
MGYSFSRQFIKNVFSGPFKIILNAIIVFFSYRYFLNTFGSEKYSVWLLLAIIIDLSRMGNLGVSDVLINYIAEARQKDDNKNLCFYFSTSLSIVSFFLICTGVILWSIRDFIPVFLNVTSAYIPLFNELYLNVIILSFLIVLLEILLVVLYGLGRADLANYYQAIGVFAGTLLSILFIYLGFDIFGLFTGNLIGTIGVIVISLRNIYNQLGYFPFRLTSVKLSTAKDIIQNSIYMFTVSIINLLFLPVGKILVSKYIGTVEVVCFDLTFKIGFQIRSFFDIALKALAAEVSSIKNDYQKLKYVFTKIYKYLFLIAVPIYMVTLIFSKEILTFWLSNLYFPLINESFRIIQSAFAINLFAVPVYYFFLGNGSFKILLGGYMVQSAVAFGLALIYFIVLNGNFYTTYLYICFTSMVLAAIYLGIMFTRDIQKVKF